MVETFDLFHLFDRPPRVADDLGCLVARSVADGEANSIEVRRTMASDPTELRGQKLKTDKGPPK